MQLSKYFMLDELTKSSFADRYDIDNIPENEDILNLKFLCLELLDKLASYFKKKPTVTSGFRCPLLNYMIKGAKMSKHIKGEAIDFIIEGISNFEIAETIKAKFKFDQLILEPSWVHVSLSRKENRNEVLTRTKNGYVKGLKIL